MFKKEIIAAIYKFKYNEASNRILSNIGWLFFDKILRFIIIGVLSVLIARHLGSELFGKWNYLIAFTYLFGAIATLGLDGIIVRELIVWPEKKYVLLGTAFSLRLFAGIFAFFASIITTYSFHYGDKDTLMIAAIISSQFVFLSTDVIDYYLQSIVQSKFSVLAKNTSFLIFACIKFYLLYVKADMILFIWVTSGEIFLSGILMLITYNKIGQQFLLWRFDKNLAITLLKDSLPLAVSGVVIILYMKIDQVMLGQMLGNVAVGEYSAALKLSESWYFIPSIVSSSLFPSILAIRNENNRLYIKKTQNMLDFLSIIGITISVIFSFFSSYIINALYGNQFANSSIILTIHIWTSTFVFIGIAGNQYLIAENLISLIFYRTLFGAFINIILNFFLIPRYGGIGSAFSTLISQIIVSYISDAFNIKSKNLFFMKTKALFMVNLFKIGLQLRSTQRIDMS